jgi:hypothetical protein
MTVFGQKPLASLSSTLLARKGTARPAMRPQGFGGFGALPGHPDDLGWNDMGHPEGETPPQQPYVEPRQAYPEQAYPTEQPYPASPVVPPVLRQREALQEEFEAPKAYEPEQGYEAEDEYEGEDEDGEEDDTGQGYADLGYAARPIARPHFEDPFEAAPVAPEPMPMPVEPRLAPVEPAPAPVQARPAPVEARPAPIEARPVSVATARRIARETHAKGSKAAFTLRLDQDRHLRLRLASALHNVSAQVLVTEALDHFLQSLPEVDELARQLPPQAGR